MLVRGALPGGIVDAARELRASRVLYVSCNPATLARAPARLSGSYTIAGIEAYDFFPQTHHVETLGVLERVQ